MTRQDIIDIKMTASAEWERCRNHKNPMYYKALQNKRYAEIIEALSDALLRVGGDYPNTVDEQVDELLKRGPSRNTKQGSASSIKSVPQALVTDILTAVDKHDSILELLNKWKPHFTPQTGCHECVEAVLKEHHLHVEGLYIVSDADTN